MRILVVENQEKHRESARRILAEHEVTIVGSFDEAIALMEPKIDEENVQRLLVEAGFPTKPDTKDAKQWGAYLKASRDAGLRSAVPFPFEVVMTEMTMPISRMTLSLSALPSNEQASYGFIVAFRAVRCGAKFVAVVTDLRHPKGEAMSEALHLVSQFDFTVNNAKVRFMHTPFVQEIAKNSPCDWCEENPGICTNCAGTGVLSLNSHKMLCYSCGHTETVGKCSQCKGTKQYDRMSILDVKDWRRILGDVTQA